jgi:ribosomal-protein-alanine acetyltransferase
VTAPTIRRGATGDLGRLVEIEEAAFETDLLTRESFAYALRSKASVLLVAERGGAVAGYGLVNFRRTSRKCRLFSLARDPAAPAGTGRALLAALEQEAVQRGCVAMRLEVRETNRRAIDLYEKAGFRRIGRHDVYYEDGAPALRFEKALSG